MMRQFSPEFLAFFRKVNGHPFEYRWVNGQCAWAAYTFAKFLNSIGKKAITRYGFYSGPVLTPFWQGESLVRHSWIEYNGRIYDPTRWCFLRTHTPRLAIFRLDCSDYDAGMNRIRLEHEPPLPPFDGKQTVPCDQMDISALFEGRVTYERLFWLANLAPQSPVFEDAEHRIRMFHWLQENGYRALVPIDNRV